MKVKFFNATGEPINEEEGDAADFRPKLRMQFKKKRGDLVTWYSLFKDMKEAAF